MREISCEKIRSTVKDLFIKTNYYIGPDILDELKNCYEKEESETGRAILEQIIENNQIAANEQIAICQDTGLAILFVKLGQEVQIVGGDFNEAINQAVREAYLEGYLRKSVVNDPLFDRKNTRDNTPAIIHLEIVPGDKIHIEVTAKGGGSENTSAMKMLTPSQGEQGVRDFVLDTVHRAGPNPCPPIIVGVGIGGSIEKCALHAKKATLRKIDQHHPDPRYAQLEKEILEGINKLGIGPGGLGGRVTALAVNIEHFPAHIALLSCRAPWRSRDLRREGKEMTKNYKKITTPLTDEVISGLKAGDNVLISGDIYTARDAGHKRFINLLKEGKELPKGKELPIDMKGKVIYYVGPAPAKPGYACGSAGPTTSSRMDSNTPPLLERGLKGMIGKGLRSPAMVESMKKNKAVYFAATGGAAALIAKSIKKVEMVAYEDLGAEALQRMVVEDFPAVVVIDYEGNNLYETGPVKYRL